MLVSLLLLTHKDGIIFNGVLARFVKKLSVKLLSSILLIIGPIYIIEFFYFHLCLFTSMNCSLACFGSNGIDNVIVMGVIFHSWQANILLAVVRIQELSATSSIQQILYSIIGSLDRNKANI